MLAGYWSLLQAKSPSLRDAWSQENKVTDNYEGGWQRNNLGNAGKPWGKYIVPFGQVWSNGPQATEMELNSSKGGSLPSMYLQTLVIQGDKLCNRKHPGDCLWRHRDKSNQHYNCLPQYSVWYNLHLLTE